MGRYCQLKSSKRSDVMPAYERKLKKGCIGKIIHLLRLNIKRPDILLNALRCRLAYKKHCVTITTCSYVVLFLHYQPERTTAPDGKIFANQLLAAALLKKALPDGVELVVKEHPSTFNRGADLKHRWPSFYQDFVNLGVSFVPVELDTYQLIDNCVCVASVGGTVVAEAILRSKPAVYFGLGPAYPVVGKPLHYYDNLEAYHCFANM